MSYKVYYNELYDISGAIKEKCEGWQNVMNNIKSSEEKLAYSDDLKGEGATSIRKYIEEVHITIQKSFYIMIESYKMKLLTYVQGYKDISGDSDPNLTFTGNNYRNVLLAHELEPGGVVYNKTYEFAKATDWFQQEVNRICNSISDLMHINRPSSDLLMQALVNAKQIAVTTDDKVKQHESASKSGLPAVCDTLEEIKGIVIKQLSTKRISVAAYTGGGIRDLCDVNKLNVALTSNVNDIALLEGTYQEALKSFEEVKGYKDFEIREKQAKWIKIGIYAVASVGLIVATVATGGAAALAIGGAIGAVEGAANSITDIYVQKGSGTDFLGNVFSKDFYSKFTFEDWTSFATQTIVGTIDGILEVVTMRSVSVTGVKAAFKDRAIDKFVAREVRLCVGYTGDIVETVAIGLHDENTSFSEISDKINKLTKDFVIDSGKNIIFSPVETFFGDVTDKFNKKIGLNKLVDNGGVDKFSYNVIKPTEKTIVSGVENVGKDIYDYVTGQEDSFDVVESFTKDLPKNFVGDTVNSWGEDIRKKVPIEQQTKAHINNSIRKGNGYDNKVNVVTFGDGTTGVTKEAYDETKGMTNAERAKTLNLESAENPKFKTVNKERVTHDNTKDSVFNIEIQPKSK